MPVHCPLCHRTENAGEHVPLITLQVLERVGDGEVLKREEESGVSLTWRGGDSIMVRHERTRRRR